MRLVIAIILSAFIVHLTEAQLYSPSGSGSVTNGSSNVGIGTSTPGGKLEINHAGGQLKLSGGTVAGGLWTNYTDVLYLADWSTGTKGLNLNLTSGNLGIGATNISTAKFFLVENVATKSTPLAISGNFRTLADGVGFHHNFLTFSATTYLSGDATTETSGEYAKNWHMGIGSDTYYYNSSYFTIYNKGQRRFMINDSGSIGIGTDCPGYKFEVHSPNSGNVRLVSTGSSSSNPAIDIFDNTHGSEFVISPSAGKVDLFTYSGHPLAFGTNNSEKMRILTNGNVGIGTTNPDHKLTVNGTLHVKEVLVDLSIPAPDYVFEKEYDLLSLSELETYVKANKHLPEVPSAKEMEANGLNLKEMNLLLLKKVEELTLHLIEIKKENEKQSVEISEQKKEIESIKALNK